MGKSTISMVIFNSYFDITRGYMDRSKCSCHARTDVAASCHIWPKPPFAMRLEHWSLAGCAQSQADDRPVVISISTVYQPTGLRSNGEPSPCFPISVLYCQFYIPLKKQFVRKIPWCVWWKIQHGEILWKIPVFPTCSWFVWVEKNPTEISPCALVKSA